MNKCLVMNPQDNVATTIQELKKGEKVTVTVGEEKREITITQDIPFGHKFAIAGIAKGDDVFKYGESIGRASLEIQPGDHVHVQNLESKRGRGDWE